MRIKRIWAPIIAGLLLLMLILPQWALADGPGISTVSVTDITSITATITWTTNTSSDSQVNYGITTGLGNNVYTSTNVTNHYIPLTGLLPDTIYYFEVISGSERSPVDAGAYYTFKTLSPAGYYSITLEPVCGVCGELIEVEVCGEVIGVTAVVAMAGTYHVCWDSLTNVKVTFTTTMPGVYEVAFYLPEAAKGIHNVYLVDNTYAQKAYATFEVLPFVKIDPEAGPVGTAVTLNGYGFTASKEIQIKFKDTVIQTTTANTVGSWPISYTIPPTPAGGYIFEVQAKEGTVWVGWVSKYFKVTPSITVTPGSGTVGQTIEVSGKGFASKEEGIEVTFDEEVVKKNIYADENGSWSATIAVPARISKSDPYIIDASGMLTRARDVPGVGFRLVTGVSVEPGFAYVGDTITVAGGGFALGETGIKVTFDGTVVASGITAGIDGCWESSFVLPASTYGSHTVSASGDTTGTVDVEATLNTQAKIVELSPVEGAPGDSITLTGNGFHSSQQLTVTIGGVAVPENMQPTQFNGNVAISFRVPKESLEGKRTLVVTDEGGATASVDFTVTKKTLSTTPLPISPKDSTLRSGRVTFQWGTGGDTGYTYTLQISETAAFPTNIRSKSGIAENSYTLTDTPTVIETLSKGTYYWRVKIVDDYGNEGAWSDSIKFTVSPIPTWVWVVVGLVVLVVLMVVAYRETKFKVTE
ncbi:MAG: IPT/TIG domain-containing protein [Dehalococcoidia bacterium]|nr:IPT/TIG domain-containing protein [Dehalococcoidia bacterium]